MSTFETLKGKKIAVLLETEFIYSEMTFYKEFFTTLGAEVHFMSYLWGEKSKTFISDIDSPDAPIKNLKTWTVDIDVTHVDANDYDAVLMGANYCAVRLREIPPMGSFGSIEEIPTPAAVKFYAEAMKNKNIVKGALCHGLWILTPNPELLKGRKVICHTVVLADIHNAGADYVGSNEKQNYVVVDDDLVTGRSAANVEEYCVAIKNTILEKSKS